MIGGGVIGLACAHYLLDQGKSVQILEMDRVGSGSSQANCGLITPSHAPPLAVPGVAAKALRWMFNPRSPFYLKPTLRPSTLSWFLRFAGRANSRDMMESMAGRGALLNSSRELYDGLLAEYRMDCEWDSRGVILVYRTEKEMRSLDAIEGGLSELGVRSKKLLNGELQELEPALQPDVHGGRLYEIDAWLRPNRLVEELERMVRERGADIRERCPVWDFDVEGDRIRGVHTPDGVLQADHFILATGAWGPKLGGRLGLRLPIQPGKGYSITMKRPEVCPSYALVLMESKIAVTPWPSGYRLGGTMEFAGYSEGINETRVEAIIEGAADYLREPVASGERELWSGWRPMTPDGMPHIGRSPNHRNLFVAAGHGMLGVSMAPATGKLVSELVTDAAPHVDPRPYRVDR